MTLAYRRAIESDMALVIDSWVDSYRTSHAAGMIPMHQYRAVYLQAVRWVLDRPGVRITVAYKPGEEVGNDVYGWIAVESDAWIRARIRRRVDGQMRWLEEAQPAGCPYVLYCYVREPYRLMGIARGLFEAAGVDIAQPFMTACKTPASTDIERKLGLQAQWKPLIARYPKPTTPKAES